MEFQAVVLAAGRGSRITDLTAKTPKPLLPVANKPMIWYTIQMLETAGFEEAIVVVLDTQQADIQKALVDICAVKIRLDFVAISAGEDLGTADTLRLISPKIKTDVLVVSCDLITSLPLHRLADVHRTYNATLTMLLAKTPDTSEMAAPGGKASKKIERDIVGLAGNRVAFMASEADFEECISFKKSFFKRYPNVNVQTQLLDAHLYLMKQWVLELLAQDKSINTVKGELVPYLVRKQLGQPHRPANKGTPPNPDTSIRSLDTRPDIYSLAVEDDMMKLAQSMSSWIDHRGDMADCYHGDKIRCYAHVMDDGLCLRANTLLTYCESNRQLPRQLSVLAPGKDMPMVHPAATIASKSQVGFDSMVGEGTSVGEKVSIKRSVIGKHCTVGERAKITNSIIMDHVTISEGVSLTGCVISNNVHLGEKCELKDCLVGNSQSVMALGKFTNEIIVDFNQMMEI